MTVVSGSVTVGIDIGTTAVKAVAADENGAVLARARIPHRLMTPAPDQLEHDAGQAWRRGPLRALAQVTEGVGELAGVCVTSMVPSLAAVDRRGMPRSPGLLYGDARGREIGGPDAGDTDSAMPDAGGFVRWAVHAVPEARGYWPAQAVANYALGRVPAIDTGTAICMGSMRTGNHWNDDVLTKFGVTAEQLPVVVPMGQPAGTLNGSDAVLAAGTVDALCDQIVSGATQSGDVLVIFGATLIVWAVVDDWVEAPGLWTLPHTVAGKVLVGGPSNAGALFVDWARAMLEGARRPTPRRRSTEVDTAGSTGPAGPAGSAVEPERRGDPGRVPVWTPYLRGERAPYHDTTLRAGLHDLDMTHDAQAVERAAYEASGFVIRHMLDRAGIKARRIVASGGGTHVTAWMQGVADASGLPVDTVAVAEGSALGAAYIARWTAGLEASLDGAQRWARVGRRVEPDARWAAAASERYARFLAFSPAN